MQSSRDMCVVEQQELADWLVAKNIQLNHRTLRQLSDVVNMAQLFKNNLNGKLVDMKNYTSHGNVELKILNWETFNLKVLRRTGLLLMRPALVQLATGNMEAIKSLLHHLMRIERDGLQLCLSSRRTPLKSLRQLVANKEKVEVTPQQSQMEMQTQTQTEMIESQTQTQADIEPEAAIAVAVVKAIEKMWPDGIRKLLHFERVVQEKDRHMKCLFDLVSNLVMRIISSETLLLNDKPSLEGNIRHEVL